MYKNTILAFFLTAAVFLAGCPKRGTGEIDVDEIQSHVDTIDRHLKAMKVALKASDLDEAEDRYEEAVEVMEEESDQLSAYPEVEEVKSRLDEAGAALCFGFVDITLKSFFQAVRAKEADRAADRLSAAKAEFKRCRDKICGRDDFIALKMNLESAPQALIDLKKEIAKAALVEKVDAVNKELEPRLAAVEKQLVKLQEDPNQKDLAVKLDREIKAVRSMLEAPSGLEGIEEWIAFKAKTAGRLAELDSKRDGLVRRGKVLWTVSSLLPRASKVATQAVTAKNRAQAREKVRQALSAYTQCLEMVTKALSKEPALAKFKFKWRGGRKNVAWLKSHCRANRRITGRMLKKLGGKAPSEASASGKKKSPVKKDKKSVEKKKKRRKKVRRRRGRIRRW